MMLPTRADGAPMGKGNPMAISLKSGRAGRDYSVDSPVPVPLPPAGTQKVFNGTAGNNHFTGTNKADTFNMGQGGNDTVSGKGGNDVFNFGGALTKNDKIDGGSGNDKVNLGGNYTGAHALKFGAATMKNVETLHLANNSYDLTMNDGNVAANHSLTVDARALAGTRTFTFNGAPEKNGSFTILCGSALSVVTGGHGDDTFSFAGGFRADDRIDGGGQGMTGDTLALNGDYATHPLIFQPDTIKSIENLDLAGGHSYTIVLDKANVAFADLNVDGSALHSGNRLRFDGSAISSGGLSIEGGAGNDDLIGGQGNDFIAPGKGHDIADGRDGNDFFDFGARFDATDQAIGGAGRDTLFLSGNYPGLVFGPSSIDSIETILLGGGHNYNLTLDAGNIAAGETLTIDARAMDTGNSATIDASAIVDGHMLFLGGNGDDTFTIGQSGFDVVRAGDGNDTIIAPGTLLETDHIDGGAGDDTLVLATASPDRFEFQSTTIQNVEHLYLPTGHQYNLATADGTVEFSQTLEVDASSLGVGNHLIFDGSKETDGRFIVTGGAGGDTIIGSADGDVLTGGGSRDILTGGGGTDTFAFDAVSDSTGPAHDIIVDMDFAQDRLQVPVAVTDTDPAVTTGTLFGVQFDADMTAAMAGKLNPHHALQFTPSGGTLQGRIFLIIDQDGTAGYISGADIVIELSTTVGVLNIGDFI